MPQTPLLILLAVDTSPSIWPLRDIALMRFSTESLLVNQLQRYQALGFEQAIIVVSPAAQAEANTSVEQLRTLQARIVVQPEPKGIGDALLQAGLALSSDLSRPVYVARVQDIVDDALHQAMLSAHYGDKSLGLIAGYETESFVSNGYLNIDETGRVRNWQDRQTPYGHIMLHLHSDAARLMNTLRDEFQGNPAGDPYPRILEGFFKGSVYRAVGAGKGFLGSLDYPWQVLDVMNQFLGRIQGQIVAGSAFVSDQASIIGDVFIGAGARIFPGATISGPVYIGAGSFVANNTLVRNCMIMNNCEIGFNCEVARSYIADNCSLHASTVLDSVFASGINFSAGCVTANLRMDRTMVTSEVNGKKRETGRRKLGAVIGRDTFISINSSLMPGVKIGERTQIGPGVQLFDDIPDEKRVFAQQQINIEDRRRK